MMDLGTTFRAAVERDPDALAIVDGEVRRSYREWLARIETAAAALQRRGVRAGTRVVTVLRNGEPLATVYWAAQLLGATLTPVNWRLSRDETTFIIEDAEPHCVITEPEELFAESHPPAQFPQVDDETYSIMLYTSGTTGRPKGVLRTHRAERAAALAHIAQNRYARDERTLGVMPLYHTMGVRSLIAMAMLGGAFVAMPRWDAATAARLLEEEQITNLYLAPTLYYDLLAVPSIDTVDFRALRKLGFAGAPMTPALVERCFSRFAPDVFVNHYGSTEIYTFTINDDLRRKPASAGKAGLNERVRVQDGEIVVHMSSPEAFSGYWKRPDAQARAIRDGWYHTGDAGRLDEDGDLYVLGRVDDMIITGGENVYPAEVEDVLARCPAIGRIAVIGVPDERLSEKIVAFVEARDSGATAEELDAYARGCGMTQFKR
ncbi:MAG: class I adenylate-forming enzyme family protein, partial [Vulcanimicrobiaceae bacterium]